jgi:hypothetical protein
VCWCQVRKGPGDAGVGVAPGEGGGQPLEVESHQGGADDPPLCQWLARKVREPEPAWEEAPGILAAGAGPACCPRLGRLLRLAAPCLPACDVVGEVL